MGCPTEVEIGDSNTLVFTVCTHDPDTGVLTDADAVPDYRVYENESSTSITSGSMAKLDDSRTTGFYSESITISAGNGYENGKTYTIYIEATVDSDKGGICYGFTAYDYRTANVTAISSSTTAADNLELACANYSATRGLTGTALPAAAADGAGGVPISDAGGLDLDGLNTNITNILTDTGTTLDNHLTDIKGTGFVKDTHSLIDIEGYVDLIDDATSGLAKIASDIDALDWTTLESKVDTIDGIVDAILVDTGTTLQGELDGIQTDTEDIQSRLPAALSAAGNIKADVLAISSSATAADNLEALMVNVSAGAYSSGAYSTGCREFLTKAPGANSAVALDLMVERIYQLMFNKMNITDTDGSIALRNAADDGDACTGSVTDDATTTVRSSMTWL